jgi:hypothetical protein
VVTTVSLVVPATTDVVANVTATVEVTGTVSTLVSVEPDTVTNDVLTAVDAVVNVVKTELPSVNEGAIV